MAYATIGILGGIGPESTGDFYVRLIRRFQEVAQPKDNTDYPRIIINSIPAPFISSVADSERLKYYFTGLQQLEKAGAEVIVLACNTTYAFLDVLQKEVGVPILDLPAAMQRHMESSGIQKVTVLATPMTLAHGLYTFPGFTYHPATSEEIAELEQAILNFNTGQDKQKQIAYVDDLVRAYTTLSDVIILGCTEVAFMMKDAAHPTLDPMDILIEETLKELSIQ